MSSVSQRRVFVIWDTNTVKRENVTKKKKSEFFFSAANSHLHFTAGPTSLPKQVY